MEGVSILLGPGGVPRGMGLAVRGDVSSGRTTLALRLVAEAQAAGSIAAWLDLAAALDPDGKFAGLALLKPAVVAGPANATPTAQAVLVPADAVRDFLKLRSGAKVEWRFVDDRDVPKGPWRNWSGVPALPSY